MRQPTNNPVFAELLADVERYINKMYVEEEQDEIIYTTNLFDFASTALEAEPPAVDYTEFDPDSSMPRVFGTDPDKSPSATPSELDKLALMSESHSIGSAPYPQEIDHALFSPQKGKTDETLTPDLAKRLEQLDESFARTVLRLIDEREMNDVEVYKRANMSRQLFAKIRKDDDYHPTKRTACALAFALELDHQDALALLSRAGYTLSHSSKFDIIVEYFFLNSIYDISKINMTLYAFDQQILC